MSDARRPRLPIIALGCAVLAVVVASVAAIRTLSRSPAPTTSRASDSATVLGELSVSAANVYKLVDGVEIVVEAGQPIGVRPTDAALARTLGLGEEDIVTALSGRATVRESDVADVIMRAGSLHVTALFADVERRGGARRTLRWRLDGDLADARNDALAADNVRTAPAAPSRPGDPLGSIVRLDDTHYSMPRATLELLASTPALILAGSRIEMSRKGNQRPTYTIAAVSPASALAHLGGRAGDSITALNRQPIGDIDDLAMWFLDAKRGAAFTVDLVRSDGTPTTIHIAITK